jgi:hypothetical protein
LNLSGIVSLYTFSFFSRDLRAETIRRVLWVAVRSSVQTVFCVRDLEISFRSNIKNDPPIEGDEYWYLQFFQPREDTVAQNNDEIECLLRPSTAMSGSFLALATSGH